MKIIVGCDADGILTNVSEHNLREGKKVFKREPVDVNAYSLEDMFDVKDIPKPILYAKAFGIYSNYCKNEPPREYIKETFDELIDDECEFHSITARKFATINNALGNLARKWYKNWLDNNGIRFNTIQFCDEVNSQKDKLLACNKLNVDVMVEDKPEIAIYLAQNGIKVIMIDAPYNLDVKHENIIHVTNWKEAKIVIKDLKQKKELKGNKEFVKVGREELESYTNEQKEEYFNLYKVHLKNLEVNEEAFKKGDRKFKLIFSMLKYPVKMFYNVKVFNKENIPYQNGFILASNHTDSTDQYRLGLALGNRPFVGFAAKEIENSFRGSLFKSTGLGIFVDRKDPVSRNESATIMAKYVAHDRIALIFPEGTRKNKDEEGRKKFQNKFQMGTVSLAQKTGTAILPVATNAFGHDTVVRFGELIYVYPNDDLEEANKKLELTIAKLSLDNITYYYTKKNMLADLEDEINKYNDYISEIGINSYEDSTKNKVL